MRWWRRKVGNGDGDRGYVATIAEGEEEDLTQDDEKPGSVVKAEEFVEDDGSPVGVDAVVSGKREMQGTVVLK